MLSWLSSLMTPYRKPESFTPDVRRGVLYTRAAESLPDRHVVPIAKFRLLKDMIIDGKLPFPVFDVNDDPLVADLERVHDPRYLDDFLNLDPTPRITSGELPLTFESMQFFMHATRATVEGVRMALESRGRFYNICGGFHHAYRDHAEGFCFLNDVVVAVEAARYRQSLDVLIIDLDVHQGNGIASFYPEGRDTFVFSMHQSDNYPLRKEKGQMDIAFPSGTKGDLYLGELDKALKKIANRFRPDLMIYVAGVDPHEDDMLGGLRLTTAELARRDELVTEFAERYSVPSLAVTAGGYTKRAEDVAALHLNTLRIFLRD